MMWHLGIYYIFTLYNSWLLAMDCISCMSFMFEYFKLPVWNCIFNDFIRHWNSYVNLFVVWPSDIQLIRILICFICRQIYLYLFFFVFVKKKVYIFAMSSTFWSQLSWGMLLAKDDNTVCNWYYSINQCHCFICFSTEAVGIVWTAQIQFHTIQTDFHFLIRYTKCKLNCMLTSQQNI